MKTKNIFYSLLLLALLASAHQVSARVMKEKRETFSCEKNIRAATLISFTNKIGPLRVETWDKSSVKDDVTVTIEGEEDQVKKALDYIKNINFSEPGDTVAFNTRCWKNVKYGSNVTFFNVPIIGGQFKLTLNDGETATLKKFDLSFVLTMPRGNPLALTQAYENVSLPDLDGRIRLNLYESDLVAGKLPDCRELTAKYGKVEIDSVKDIRLKLYETRLNIRHAGNVVLDSKYSETGIGNAGSLDIDSYEDKIHVPSHGDLAIKAKYTTFTLADFDKGTFDLYECTLNAGKANIVAISAKYCSFGFVSCHAVVFTGSYENKFTCGQAGDLKAASKYSSYKISNLDGNLNFMSSYEDKITVKQVGRKFTGISLTGKYTAIDLSFENGAACKIDADLKYTGMDFLKTAFREIRYHKEDELFQFLGVTAGSDENAVSEVKFRMYEGSVKLR
ncbi:MAG: hypothetical protein WCK34_12280 [Bacteroidota bacterium]